MMYLSGVNHMNGGSVVAVLSGLVIFMLLGLLLLLFFFGSRLRRIEYCAYTDQVTGGMNRIGLEKKSRKYLNGKTLQHTVVVMEVCNYRQMLHAFGREKTEQALKYLYGIIKTNLGNTEPMARINGGTFCFFIKNREKSAILTRLNRIADHVDRQNRKEQVSYQIEIRFGICIPETCEETLEEIQERITEELENSEEQLCFCQNRKGNSPVRKWELIQQMETSLTNGDFLVYLQPKVQLSDSRIVGAEALLRWRHPERGMLKPEMFVPLLEEFHLIARFDLYLFEQVCLYMDKWRKEGKSPCPISVNLSHETIRQKDFLDPYVQLVQKYSIAPEMIEFELSRTLQEQDVVVIRQIVERIHACNFRCSLDRFGGSTVLLHLLRELDVDTVKMDSSFFSGENNNRRNRFVVEAILKIASQMQIRTVAEGIDNDSQVRYLQQAGCDMVQGYYYFQPLSLEEFSHTVYQKGELRYVEEDNNRPAQADTAFAHNASGNIVMFSMLLDSDRVIFSNLFSPVLEGQTIVSNAMSLFRYSELIHENDRKDFFNLLDRCRKENGWVENSMRFYTARGRYEWLEMHLYKESIPAAGETVVFGTLVNMAGWKNEVNRWKDKANRDALTGLYNREYFEQFAGASLEKNLQTTAAIIFVDIDDFKQVNDTMGHVVGDDVICWFAKRVLGVFRHTDIVARYGGDEFVVFVNGISREDLRKRLQQLCDGFRYPYRNGDVEYAVSGSIGAAMYPEDGESYLQLLDCADSALYEAKRQGKNCFVIYTSDLEQPPQ